MRRDLYHPRHCPRLHGLTLVELLVVIGIVSVLIAILLPTLGRAREAARRVKCLANLRSMGQAAHLHALDHKGFMPFAGDCGPRTMNLRPNPHGLDDRAMLKYSYYDEGNSPYVKLPMPLPAALGQYMGIAGFMRSALSSMGPLDMRAAMEREDLRKYFTCPSQDPDTIMPGYTISDGVESLGPKVYISYVANTEFLGRYPLPEQGYRLTPGGQVNKVKRPAQVMLFTDGSRRPVRHLMTMQTNTATGLTLYSYWRGPGMMWGQFDYPRHRNLMNAVFVDGHAETLAMPRPKVNHPDNHGDFERVGLQRGIYE